MNHGASPVRDPATTLVANLELIDRSIAGACRSCSLPTSEVDEFASWAKERLIDDDYAILRKFQGRSSLATYLRAVVARLFLDYRNQHWGRWRPSAAATRLGPLAVEVERRVYRDGQSPAAALDAIRADHCAVSPKALRELYAMLPRRWASREVAVESAATVAGDGAADGRLWASERARAAAQVRAALESVMADLPAEDRVIVRMRYWDELSVADIARVLGLEAKPLYRRLQAIHARLRAALTTAGIGDDVVTTALSDPGS